MFPTLAFINDIGGGEILIIGIVALLLFGKQLPVVLRNFGKSYAILKTQLNDAKSEITREVEAAANELESAKDAAKIDDPLRELNGPVITDTPALAAPAPSSGMPRIAPAENSIAQGSTADDEKPRQPAVSDAAALDQLERNIAPPKKIPPPVM